jgi:hypothetical protein
MSCSPVLLLSERPIRSRELHPRLACRRLGGVIVLLVLIFGFNGSALADVTASIVGTVKDATGAVIPGAQVTVTNNDTHITQAISTNGQGFYTFPALQPGNYSVIINLKGFKAFQQTGIILKVNDVVTVDGSLQVGDNDEVVTVTSEALHVETASTQLGEVIEGQQMTSVPLNGRSYTDLLALQPGVANSSSALGGGSSSNNNFQSGSFQLPQVSGGENAGNQSVNGMRESANGYLLNGISVQEFGFSGTAVIPNLDSVSEFRIITNNFDAEYGDFAGGQVNVVTKSGTNSYHGNAFEFLRNTDFDAANYFDQGARGAFQQNQFGGTAGGPIKKDKIFFFGDYQGNRNVVGVSTGSVAVPTLAERSGDFSAPALESAMSGSRVQGAYWANTLAGELGYGVTAGEPYYSPGCTVNTTCVFPNAIIPASAISPISKSVLALGAIPVGNGQGLFSTSADPQRLTDDKFSGRVDANTEAGALFGYYAFDQFTLLNPFPIATVPGFSGNTTGRTQALDIGDTKTIGSSAVNEARIGYLRLNDLLNSPVKTISTTLNALGFNTSGGPGSIYPLFPANEGIPEMDFENFNIGEPSRVFRLIENTYQAADNFSKLIGTHSLKFGAAYHFAEIQEQGQNAGDGYFQFDQTLETGVDFADFLVGAPGNFIQGQTPPANTRSFYLGAFAQDSWHARPNLTLNYGVRWDVITPWWEQHNELETLVLGEQSVVFPNAPTGWVFPGDPGVPKTIAPIRWNNFAPRLGLAYSPSAASGLFNKLFGSAGQSSIRLGYGLFYNAFEGGYDFSVIGDAPYGDFYSSSAPPSFANPYQTRASGAYTPSPFPYTFPPNNVSASNPDPNVPASAFGVIGTSPGFNVKNRVPYAEQYELSFQRQISGGNLLTLSYVGTEGHRLLANQEANPVNEAACLAIYNMNPSNPACGPNSEPTSLRGPFGANFGSEGLFSSIAKSGYNSLQVNFQHNSGPLQFLVGYTFSKSMDDSSSFGEEVNPFDPTLSRGLSSFNIPQNFVVSYTYALPTDRLRGPRKLVGGWQLSGITTFSSGIPVFIFENDDNSLLGTNNSGPIPLGIDTPNYSGGSVQKLNPRKLGNLYFNTSGFSAETIGHLGTARRSFFQGPGINNFNTALSKNAKFFERYTLEFRAEFFNVFNHTQFESVPQSSGNFDSSEFGEAPAAADPRIGQLALKLQF